MKQIPGTKYYWTECGNVVKPLKPTLKGRIRYWNLMIEKRLRAFSEKRINSLTHEHQKRS
jgi:hypothetical protein